MPETYNKFPQTIEEFLSNPNSYTYVKIAPYSMHLSNEEKKRIAEVLETNETVNALLLYSSSSMEDESMEDEWVTAFAKMGL